MNFANVAAQQSTTSGTADFVVSDSVFNCQRLSDALVDGEVYTYRAHYADNVSPGWEVGRGVWTDSSNTLARDTILDSSNNGSAVSFSGDPLVVEIVVAADQLAKIRQRFTDTSESVSHWGSLSGSINGSNTVFTCSQGAYRAGSTWLFVNKQFHRAYSETSPSAGTITLDNPPQAGDELDFSYDL